MEDLTAFVKENVAIVAILCLQEVHHETVCSQAPHENILGL
jgi:hypothetical protein